MQEIEERPLLEPLKPDNESKKCMVIDLDETLVHSSFVVSTWNLNVYNF